MADEDAQPVTICMEELDCANFAGWKLYMIVLERMKGFAVALLHLAGLFQRLFFIDI